MKNLFYAFLLLFFVPLALPAQLTFYKDVLPVVQQKCGNCHKPEGAAPFSLASYTDVVKRASFIVDVIESGYMPPYPADPFFAEHANANYLEKAEIELVKQWIKEGKKEGKRNPAEVSLTNTASVPVAKPDLVLTRPKPFVVSGDNKEKFKIFVLPTGLQDTAYVTAIEYVPGNARRTHHSRIMIDTSTKLRRDDGIDVGDESALQKNNITIYDEFWKGWVPGNNLVFYPPGMAKVLPPKTDLLINTHYSASPLADEDNFAVKLYFAKEKPRRMIRNFILEERSIRNGPFFLPPDTVITFYMQSPPLPFAISMISVLPHMHALGKSFKAFAIAPDGNVIPLISIPEWRFNWQLTYPFKHLLKIPEGAIIYVQAKFDNTANNLANPNNPPKPVYNGWGTRDEMLNLIMEYVEYEPGDETISVQTPFPFSRK